MLLRFLRVAKSNVNNGYHLGEALGGEFCRQVYFFYKNKNIFILFIRMCRRLNLAPIGN